MKSKWFDKKDEARKLRKKGYSIRNVERELGIPRSTLSGWFKDIELTDKQKTRLKKRWERGLVKARKEAVKWHRAKKEKRHQIAKKEALKIFNQIDTSDKKWLEITLAIMYFGEGFKRDIETAIGNSDPMILKFFLSLLKEIYDYDIKTIYCQLNLRHDQNIEKEKKYWSRTLGLPKSNFRHVLIDKRTKGTKTYKDYHGVCQLRCGRVDIQRRLLYLANIYCDNIVKKYL
jgi:hypothetical protein